MSIEQEIEQRTHRAKKALVAIAIGLLWAYFGAFEAHADSAVVTLYNEANALYKDGHYEEAIARYEQVLDTGLQNGYVYYNLANAYFKNNRIGKAILFYERALKLLPRDEDVKTNLRFANLLKADKDPPPNENPIVQLVLGIHYVLNPGEQAILCSVLFFLIAGVAIMMIFADARWRSYLITAMCILGVVLVLSGMSLAAKIYAREFVEMAIVMVPKVDAMSGPGEEYTRHFILHEGTKIAIERQSGGWFLMRLPNGLGGWIKASAIEKI